MLGHHCNTNAVFFCFQVLTFLISIILRALVNQKVDPDDESVQDTSGRPWEPLLHPASGSSRSDMRGTHSDSWSARMRGKVKILPLP